MDKREVIIDGVKFLLDENEQIESLKEFDGAYKKEKKEDSEED